MGSKTCLNFETSVYWLFNVIQRCWFQ